MLKRNARRDDGHAAQRAVDLIGEIGERVRECVVDRALRGAGGVEPGQLAIARVRADEPQLGVEDRDRQRNRLEEQLETSNLRRTPIVVDDRVARRRSGVRHKGDAARTGDREVAGLATSATIGMSRSAVMQRWSAAQRGRQ